MSDIFHLFPAEARVRDPVALLVDGENLPPDLALAILNAAAFFGAPTVRRVYGKAEHLTGWNVAGFRPVPTHPGKNAADILLCVEAMSLALSDAFKTILIASSDRDFTHVATHLRELGHRVVGMGEAKAPAEFRAACSDFVVLERGKVANADAGTKAKQAKPPALSIVSSAAAPSQAANPVPNIQKAQTWLRKRLEQSDAVNGVPIASLGQQLRRALSVSASHYGYSSLGQFLRAYPKVFDCDPKGAGARVRLVRAARPVTALDR